MRYAPTSMRASAQHTCTAINIGRGAQVESVQPQCLRFCPSDHPDSPNDSEVVLVHIHRNDHPFFVIPDPTNAITVKRANEGGNLTIGFAFR